MLVPMAAAEPMLFAELEECGHLPLPSHGGLLVDVPPYGPPLNLADIAPLAGRLFVATARAVVGFRLPAAPPRREPGVEEPMRLEVEVEVPLSGRALRLRCSTLGGRPVVAVVDDMGTATVFWADANSAAGSRPHALRISCPGTPPTRGLAVVPVDGGGGSYLYVGNSSGQLCRWQLRASTDGGLTVGPAMELRPGCAAVDDVAIVDIDAAVGGGVLAAGLDGRLELWMPGTAPTTGCGRAHEPCLQALSEALARADCSEVPTLWGVRWLPLHAVPAPGLGEAPMPPGKAAWAALPMELVCRVVLPFLPLSTLAGCLASVARAYGGIVEQELSRPARRERLVLCVSDCTAWLLDEGLKVLARQDLPFCAAHSNAVVLSGTATVLLAPKTDLVALPGSRIVVVPHLWALSVWRSRGSWQPRLKVRRLDLRPPCATAAADVGGRTVAWGRPAQEVARRRPKDPAHVMGLAEFGGQLLTLLASGELLIHHMRSPLHSGAAADGPG